MDPVADRNSDGLTSRGSGRGRQLDGQADTPTCRPCGVIALRPDPGGDHSACAAKSDRFGRLRTRWAALRGSADRSAPDGGSGAVVPRRVGTVLPRRCPDGRGGVYQHRDDTLSRFQRRLACWTPERHAGRPVGCRDDAGDRWQAAADGHGGRLRNRDATHSADAVA
ncbi:MAG: hypothetical protein QOF90_1089 [Acetobacteraceae bacterium]|nr:hypothetical protein [Acetobacteraceae bacterium]